jgi:aminoglycoside phosphotransferase (APT) family kinase protein
MPAPAQRDLARLRAGLRDWLAARMPAADALELSELHGPAATGYSSDTLLFRADWRERGAPRSREWVARFEPLGPAVFPEYDVGRQFRIQRALAKSEVPVAPMLWLEEDPAPLGSRFYVMERVEGRVPPDSPPYHVGGWVTEVAPAERASIWWSGLEAMAALHRMDANALGVELSRPEPGATPLERELAYWRRYLAWAARGRAQPVCEAAFAWLDEHGPPPEGAPAPCWGDARIGNMIFAGGRCAAMLDWEMATHCDPSLDLAWWLFLDRHHAEGLGVPRLAGFPERAETVARWEALTARRAQRLDWWEIFAGLRFAAIMCRVAQVLVAQGALPADSTLETENPCARLLATLLERCA